MIFVGLGANLPFEGARPVDTLRAALGLFPECGLSLVSVSRAFESPAWPDPSEPPFVNAVAAVSAALDAEATLGALHRIEARFGRERTRPNAPRTLDLDLLDHGGAIRPGPGLILPHPRLGDRPFVLLPLRDVAPGWRHPVSAESIETLLAALPPGWTCRPVAALRPPGVETGSGWR